MLKVAIIDEPAIKSSDLDEPFSGELTPLSLEDLVNSFIKDKKVIDIKYAIGSWKSVMVMYEEEE
ncbi:MAG TPA: hypothetical protein H9958_09540 [Candidatus Limosilactobacillus intestinavium]|nr:hypothetical protein [Candidatus Limosilactobacillus intestinavium]